MIVQLCMRNLLIIWKISTEIFFWKIGKKNFEKYFTIFSFFFFFSSKIFSFRFFLQQYFFPKCFFENFFNYSALGCRDERRERRGRGVGEQSEPPAGGFAVRLNCERTTTRENTKMQKREQFELAIIKAFFASQTGFLRF